MTSGKENTLFSITALSNVKRGALGWRSALFLGHLSCQLVERAAVFYFICIYSCWEFYCKHNDTKMKALGRELRWREKRVYTFCRSCALPGNTHSLSLFVVDGMPGFWTLYAFSPVENSIANTTIPNWKTLDENWGDKIEKITHFFRITARSCAVIHTLFGWSTSGMHRGKKLWKPPPSTTLRTDSIKNLNASICIVKL